MQAKLKIISGQASKSEIPLVELPLLVGRNREAGLPIPHSLVSRQHCEIYELHGALVVKDLGSANGTRINGEYITEEVLRPGDELIVGPLTFKAVYRYAHGKQVPDLETLTELAEAEDIPLFFDEASQDDVEEVVEEPVAVAVEIDSLVKSGAPRPAVDRLPPAGEDEAPLYVSAQQENVQPAQPPEVEEEEEASVLDINLEDLLLEESSIGSGDAPIADVLLPGVRGDLSPEERRKIAAIEDSGIGSRFDDEPMQLQDSDIMGSSDEISGLTSNNPANILQGDSEDIDLEDSGDFQVEDSHIGSVEDSEDFLLDADVKRELSVDSRDMELIPKKGPGSKAPLAPESPDPDLPSPLKLAGLKLRASAAAPPDDDTKDIQYSSVFQGRAWEKSGIGLSDLNDRKQPSGFHLKLRLDSAGKIQVGTPVLVAGIEVGMVESLNWVAVEGALKAEALLSIQKRLGEVLREDLALVIQDAAEVSIVIQSPGTSEKRLKNGHVVSIKAPG